MAARIKTRDDRSDGPGTIEHRERVAHRAYQLFEARGREDGHDQEDWYEAERQLNGDPNDEF